MFVKIMHARRHAEPWTLSSTKVFHVPTGYKSQKTLFECVLKRGLIFARKILN